MSEIKVIRVAVPGFQGAPGTGGDAHEVFTQSVPASTWAITHSLGKKPAVTIIDSSGSVCIGDVQYTSTSALTITFTAAFSGSALLN